MAGPLHERERELARVVEALDAAAGGRGRAVVVEGPAGIGKTSLLELARDAAHERSFAVASARGAELERAYAWGVVRQLFEPRLRGLSAGARERALAGAAALAGPVVLPDVAAPDARPGSVVRRPPRPVLARKLIEQRPPHRAPPIPLLRQVRARRGAGRARAPDKRSAQGRR